MKRECEIVQDLLFGYQDGTLHEASKDLVEEHLKKCEECRRIFSEMKKVEIESCCTENEQTQPQLLFCRILASRDISCLQ